MGVVIDIQRVNKNTFNTRKYVALRSSGSRHGETGSSTRRVSPRPETESYATKSGGGEGGAGIGFSLAEMQRMQREMRNDLEDKLHVSKPHK